MAELYFFVSKEKLADVVDCGLKLSEWFKREVAIPGASSKVKALKAYLNPRDNMVEYDNPEIQCIRLNVKPDHCKVGDGDLYNMGLEDTEFMNQYYKSLISLEKYNFGKYRNPDVLVTVSILPEFIEVMGNALDIPILYENSEALYLANRMDRHEQEYKDWGNSLLYTFYRHLESEGKVKAYEDKAGENCVFYNYEKEDYIVLRIP